MPADPALAALPALRELAEREAREAADVAASVVDPLFSWSWMSPDARERAITVRLALLSDLSRPASRDAVCRLVAERVGFRCGPTAPGFCHTEASESARDNDGAPCGDGWPAGWWLSDPFGGMQFFTAEDWCPDDSVQIAGLPDDDPIEALRLIALHVLGERP